MPQQTDLFERDLDMVRIRRRAQAASARLRTAGLPPRTAGRSDAVAAAHLDEIWRVLGGWARSGSHKVHP